MKSVSKHTGQLAPFWMRHAGLLAVCIGIAAFALGTLQDYFLSQGGFTRWSIIILSDCVTGTIAALFFYQFARHARARNDAIRERMTTIADLNHHIRNALQVIKFWGAQHQNCSLDPLQLDQIKGSVDRIEWALREVLPKYPGEGAPEEVATREEGAARTELAEPRAVELPRATGSYGSEERKPG